MDLCKELDFYSEEVDDDQMPIELYLKFEEESKGNVNIKDLLSAYIWKDRVVLVNQYPGFPLFEEANLFRLYRVNEDQEEKSEPSDLGIGGLGKEGRKQRNKRMRTKNTKKVRKTKKVKKNKDSKKK